MREGIYHRLYRIINKLSLFAAYSVWRMYFENLFRKDFSTEQAVYEAMKQEPF